MSLPEPSPGAWRRVISTSGPLLGRPARGLAFLGVIFLLMDFSVVLSPPNSSVASWWPAAGVSVAAMSKCRDRERWAMAVGLWLVSLFANVGGGRPLLVACGFATANLCEALVVTTLLRRGAAGPLLSNLGAFGTFLRSVAAGATVIAVLAGLTVEYLGAGNGFATMRAVAASHGAALLVVLPAFLPGLSGPSRRRTETVLQWALTLGVVLFVFGPGQHLPLAFLPFIPLMWGAARLNQRSVTAQVLVTGIMVSLLTAEGDGPFGALVNGAALPPETVTALVQTFLVATALISLPLSVAQVHRQHVTLALSRSEERFRRGFEEALVGMFLLEPRPDGELVVREHNPAAAKLLDTFAEDSRGDYTSVDFVSLLREQDATMLRRAMGRHHADPASSWSGEVQSPGSSTRWLEITLSPLTTSEYVAYTCQAVDISERKAAQAQLTQSLGQQEEALVKLRELDRAKDDFVANISHELRTPITSVMGYAELLVDNEDLPRSDHDMVQKIARNARRLLTLIEDVLSVSRLDAGTFRLTKERVNLNGPVMDACESIETHALARDVTVSLSLPPRPVFLVADRDQLERAVLNLVSNAVKFSHPGGNVLVTVRQVGSNAQVVVEDQGIGVPPEESDQLFQRFFRSSTAQREAVPGTGLGLSIVGAIANLHGGQVHYAPTPGGGSTFTVELPLLPGAPTPEQVASEKDRQAVHA